MEKQSWANQIDSVTNSFHESFQNLSEEELNWKPDAKTWSVAQNIHHLIVINQTYYPLIKQVREGQYQLPWIGKLGFMVNLFGSMILKSVSPDRKKKMKTFPLWEPSHSKIGGDILTKFKTHQLELKVMMESSSDLLAKGTVISSPANKNIVYTLQAAFNIIVTHEWRDFQQAIEVNELRIKTMKP